MGNEGSKGQKKDGKGSQPAQKGRQPQQGRAQQPQQRPAAAAKAGGKAGAKAGSKAGGKADAKAVLVWGSGGDGQLGLGGQQEAARPVAVPRFGQLGVVVHQLSCGPAHSAFVTAGGVVYVAGSGDSFRLGLGDRVPRAQPEAVEFTVKSACVQVECGPTFTLFLTQRGNVLACGTSKEGALGLGYSISAKMPMKTGLGEIRKISVGKGHSAAISHLGKVYTWGSIAEGKLGHASDPSAALQGRESSPKLLDNAYTRGKRFVDVACGAAHTIMVTEFGEVATCGRGEEGQLGYGGRQEHAAVRRIELVDDEEADQEEEADDTYVGREEAAKKKAADLPKAVRCFARENASAAITSKGDVWVWGDGELRPTRAIMPAGETALLVSLHPNNSLVLTASRSVFSIDLSESQVAENLEAVSVDMLANAGANWVANGGTYFMAACGSPLPTLDETRSKVVEAVEDRRSAQEFSDNRKELFGRAKKPNRPGNRELDKVDAEMDTSLSKMKADLFAKPAKKKAAEEAAPPPATAPALPSDDMDLDDFEAALFQRAGGAPPTTTAAVTPVAHPAPAAAPTPVRAAPQATGKEEKFVEAAPEARNALFAMPAKSKKKAPTVVNPFASPAPSSASAPAPEPSPAHEPSPAPAAAAAPAAEPEAAVEPPAPAPAPAPAPESAAEDQPLELRMDILSPKKLQPAPAVEELYEGDLLSDDDDDDDGLC